MRADIEDRLVGARERDAAVLARAPAPVLAVAQRDMRAEERMLGGFGDEFGEVGAIMDWKARVAQRAPMRHASMVAARDPALCTKFTY